MCVHVCVIVCVWIGLRGCPRAVKITLHRFTPIPKTLPERTQDLTQGRRGLTMNVLKCIDPSRWWCFDYTTCFQGVLEACFQLNRRSRTTIWIKRTCLLASCHCPTQTHTDTLYSICTVVSFIPTLGLIQCTLSNLGTVSAASRDYTKYKEELFSLRMQDATATFSSNPKCFCKQCYPQTAAAAAAVVECWQLWITVKAVQSLHGEQWYYHTLCQIW